MTGWDMNYAMVLEELHKWQPEESFYREYYYAEDAKRKKMLEDPAVPQKYKDIASNPLSIEAFSTEEMFFTSGRNVMLIQHPRYIPYFEHEHAFFEIIYVISGHAEQVMQGQKTVLEQGDLCIMAPNVQHGITVFDESVVMNILVRYSTFVDIFLNTVRDKSHLSAFFLGSIYDRDKIRYLIFHTQEDEDILHYILDMYMEQVQEDSYSDRIICSYLTIFFTQLNRRHSRQIEIPDKKESDIPYANELMNFIYTHYNEISLAELAEQFHFSVPYCSKIVKQISGVPFSELVTRIRLQKGMDLLTRTQMSVADISEHVGYLNPETFIRCFSRYYNMTPSQYRRAEAERTLL